MREDLDARLPALVRVVDDDAPVRESEAFVLQMAGFQVRQFESAEQFLAGDDRKRCGALVLDIRMQGMSGMELQRRIAAEGRSLPILFLTGHGDVGMAVAALRRGAADFLQKPMQAETLAERVSRLVEWHVRTARERGEAEAVARQVASLTPKEREVMELAAKGLQNKEIAAALGVSEQTVRIHRWSAARKLGVKNAAEAAQVLRAAAEAEAPVRFPFVEAA